MDGQRFDDIARSWADGVSRRKVVKSVAAGIAAAALTMVGLGKAEAVRICQVRGQVCCVNGDCCGNQCAPDAATGRRRCGCPVGSATCGATCCGKGETCQNGQCQSACQTECCADTDCAAGDSCCNGACADLLTDANSCGACTTLCGTGTSCCGGACVDLQTDAANCDACGNDCGFYLGNPNSPNCSIGGACTPSFLCG